MNNNDSLNNKMFGPEETVAVFGHVDHGKSTLLGYLGFKLGTFSEQKLKEAKELAKKAKKDTFEYAFLNDSLSEERERGVTISAKHIRIIYNNKDYTFIDTPGHKSFIKNTLIGLSQADVGLEVVSVKEGVMAQTYDHLLLSKFNGIEYIVFAVNKMDLVNYSEKDFNTCVEAIKEVLVKINWPLEKVRFVPTSGYLGLNLVEVDHEKIPWYKGKAVIEELENFLELYRKNKKINNRTVVVVEKSLNSIKGQKEVIVGKVYDGELKINDDIIIYPENKLTKIKGLQTYHTNIEKATAGMNIGISVTKIDFNVSKGDVIVLKGDRIRSPKKFIARVLISTFKSIRKGSCPQIFCGTNNSVYEIDNIEIIRGNKEKNYVTNNEVALITFSNPKKKIIIEETSVYKKLSVIILRDGDNTLGYGVCEKILEENLI